MKKNLLIICAIITTVGLTAYSYLDADNSETVHPETAINTDTPESKPEMVTVKNRIFSDFIYGIGPRFNPITKTEMNNARSFSDFIGDEHAQRIVEYKSLSVTILNGDEKTDIKETSSNGILTEAQIDLIQSANYATNLLIRADYIEKFSGYDAMEHNSWTPYITIVPEVQAEYLDGKDALVNYLKDSTKEVRANVDPEKLKPAKLFFRVTKNGNIENVYLDRTSGYPNVDKKMIELISNTSEKWRPAENAKGEKVDQELVVSFGLMGC